MKRKLFIAGATFVLVAAAVTAIAANQQTNKPTLLEANIEALESRGVGGGEGGESSGKIICEGMLGWCRFSCPKCSFSISALGSSIEGNHSCI